MKIDMFIALLVIVVCLLSASYANACPYSFDDIALNNDQDPAADGARFSTNGTEASGLTGIFPFFGKGRAACSTGVLYFLNQPLTGGSDTINIDQATTGVYFVHMTHNAGPAILLEGMAPEPRSSVAAGGCTSVAFSPEQAAGIDKGEKFPVCFNSADGLAFENAVQGLPGSSPDNPFMAGFFVRTIGTGGGNPEDTRRVPEPSTLLLFGAGLMAFGRYWKRYSSRDMLETAHESAGVPVPRNPLHLSLPDRIPST